LKIVIALVLIVLLSIFVALKWKEIFHSNVRIKDDIRGTVINPILPNLPKPDFTYCENYEECITTIYDGKSCCSGCQEAVNKKAKVYIEDFTKLNCDSIRSLLEQRCVLVECSQCKVKCENNQCVCGS
jgi:hypothetical protein